MTKSNTYEPEPGGYTATYPTAYPPMRGDEVVEPGDEDEPQYVDGWREVQERVRRAAREPDPRTNGLSRFPR